MIDMLQEILDYKQGEVKYFRRYPVAFSAKKRDEQFLFRQCLQRSSFFLIAEIKRKSPSQGEMAMERDPVELALEYKEAGADALSVLTDERYFGGSFEFLEAIKVSTGLPVLCKDFIIDEVQIERALAAGADMILLIVEVFSNKERLWELASYASSLGMDILFEVHERENIDFLHDYVCHIVGVNNRNLRTLEENYTHSLEVYEKLPSRVKKISLSAFSSAQQVQEVARKGYDGILVGTSLVRNPQRKHILVEWKAVGTLAKTGVV